MTYFDTEIDDLIVASGFPTVPIHSLNAKINGIETQTTLIPTKKIKINLSHTFTSAENKESGTALLRRPKHKLDFDLQITPSEKLEIINYVQYIGETSDVGFNGGSVYRGGYIISNIAANYKINNKLKFYGKINNILNNKYEVADGFKGHDRSMHLGFKKIW